MKYLVAVTTDCAGKRRFCVTDEEYEEALKQSAQTQKEQAGQADTIDLFSDAPAARPETRADRRRVLCGARGGRKHGRKGHPRVAAAAQDRIILVTHADSPYEAVKSAQAEVRSWTPPPPVEPPALFGGLAEWWKKHRQTILGESLPLGTHGRKPIFTGRWR